VKINRAFLGEGNAFDYAQIPDSTEFTEDQLTGQIQRLDAQGNVAESFTLQDTILDNREPGIFNGPQHKLYYFNGVLDPSATYRFHAIAKGEELTATTILVNNFSPNPTLISPIGRLGLATVGGYSNYTVRWDSGLNGKRYELSYRFNYAEVVGEDTIEKSFTQFVGSAIAGTSNGGEDLQAVIEGETFYSTVASEVTAHSAQNVSKRLYRGVDLIWAVASPELHTYLQLASPISGVVEDRPQFSNVTNGYGLFTSRFFREVQGKQLNDASGTELMEGQYTGGLEFCVPGTCD
jgi:hypothetical protein